MTLKKQQKILEDFYKELFDNQQDCPTEFIDIFNDNFWELIGDSDKE